MTTVDDVITGVRAAYARWRDEGDPAGTLLLGEVAILLAELARLQEQVEVMRLGERTTDAERKLRVQQSNELARLQAMQPKTEDGVPIPPGRYECSKCGGPALHDVRPACCRSKGAIAIVATLTKVRPAQAKAEAKDNDEP